ncbi:desmoglein-2.1 isoform X2 [Danio aesculapii]|uniref:desmoglein-2.1 isoform X2 n=1 Tax=Danio aesculapii TaxID=1142201 RepID=UPI0024BFF52B|nr:desmoglein-2.1 isoform X2 [Danio aesculapii]
MLRLLGLALVLFVTLQILSTGDCQKVSQKQRHKREWVIPSKKITENVDYSKTPIIGKIRSDMDDKVALRYTLRGPGINEPPVGCFMVEEYKGLVRIIQPLDREERSYYTLIGTAWYVVNGSIAEDNIQISVTVEDQNDNPPVFIKPERSSIYEGSPAGTFVTQVVATDADEPNTLHTKIAFSIINQEPKNNNHFFVVDKDSGIISLKNPALDREENSLYVLTIQAADMYGNATGNSATVTIPIDILDVNDNVPTLEKDEFSVSIDENEAPIEVLRIQAEDIDEVQTDNWLAEFAIVAGNEDGHFSIETDPRTNMGILYLNKPVDYESASNLDLSLIVANRAPPGAPLGNGAGAGSEAGASGSGGQSGAGGQSGSSGAGGQSGSSGTGGQSGSSGTGGQTGASGAGGQSGSSGAGGQPGASGAGSQLMLFGGSSNPGFSLSKLKSYLVKVNVKNKPDAPKFIPKVKPISVSENNKNSIPRVIDTYTATEEDTGRPAENVKYAKGYDPDNWISIDVDTAEIKLNKVPDRESPFVVNGTYYAKIICITDELSAKTSTGTIALQVEDLNDNCPILLNNMQIVCSHTKVVNVTAEDTDSDPNGAPLEFSLIQEKTKGKWNLQRIDDVSALLLAEDDLWPGFYQLTMEIRDKQGLACPTEQVLNLEVCTCSEGMGCGSKMSAVHTSSSANFGLPGIGFLVLGFLSLTLMLLFLIKCECGGTGNRFIDMPFEAKQHLISYSTETRGEDRDVPLMCPPPNLDDKGGNEMSNGHLRMVSAMNSKIPVDTIDALSSNQAVYTSSKMEGIVKESAFRGFYYDTDDVEQTVSRFQELEASLGAVLEDYLMQKSRYISVDDSTGEAITSYDYEGKGSVAGSIGSCSYSESSDDLEFLNNLDSKFRTLAEVCGYRQTQSLSQADSKVILTPAASQLSIRHSYHKFLQHDLHSSLTLPRPYLRRTMHLPWSLHPSPTPHAIKFYQVH